MSHLNLSNMKTLLSKTLMMIAAIVLVVSVNTAFAQTKTQASMDEQLVVKANKVAVEVQVPNYEGEFVLEVYDLSCQRVYANTFTNSSNQTISIPMSNNKSKILFLTVTGKDFKVSRKFYVG